jgi:hypothetical protein
VRNSTIAELCGQRRGRIPAKDRCEGHECVVEFVVDHLEHGRVSIVDVFDIDEDEKITRLAVYRR